MKYMVLSTWIQSETEKSIAVEWTNGQTGFGSYNIAWFPKSKIIINHPEDFADEKRMLIMIPTWLVKSNCNLSQYEYGRFNGYVGLKEMN